MPAPLRDPERYTHKAKKPRYTKTIANSSYVKYTRIYVHLICLAQVQGPSNVGPGISAVNPMMVQAVGTTPAVQMIPQTTAPVAGTPMGYPQGFVMPTAPPMAPVVAQAPIATMVAANAVPPQYAPTGQTMMINGPNGPMQVMVMAPVSASSPAPPPGSGVVLTGTVVPSRK